MTRLFFIILIILFITPFIAWADVNISDGDLIRAFGTFDVYIVKLIADKQFKRLILNPEIFNQYGHLKWENIKDVSPAERDEYITSDLVRAISDDKVYKLYPDGDTGEKRWIKTADDFLDLGYDWDAIYTINIFERDAYTLGEDLVAITESEPEPEEPEESETPSREPITINVPKDYSAIQAAIDAAIDGDTISVSSGTYKENLLISKNIKLIGSYAVSAIIDGQGWGAGITIDGVSDFLIQRFTIKSQDSKAIYCSGEKLSKGIIKNTVLKDSARGIYMEGNCDLTILNNLIYNNRNSSNIDGAGILIKDNYSYDFIPEIRNNTIDDNYHGIWSENANLKVINNIITYNVGGLDSSGIYHKEEGEAVNSYNNVWNNGFNYYGDALPGNGSITLDPWFKDKVQRNYRLKWDTASSYYSKCVDAGHPDSVYYDGKFYTSNLYRNDIGAYGGPDNTGWDVE